MTIESDVQLLAEGSGPKVRTITVTTLIDGEATDVEMQVIAISDKAGRLIADDAGWREEMLTELRKQTEWLELIAAAVSPGA